MTLSPLQALAILENGLGAEHPYVADTLNDLAELYRNQGKFTEPEPLYKREPAVYENAPGAEHP